MSKVSLSQGKCPDNAGAEFMEYAAGQGGPDHRSRCKIDAKAHQGSERAAARRNHPVDNRTPVGCVA
ncbi:hypothetical protein [Nannocystis bainbridge]|uniref:Uncharacterized protein n=1 Tax=Nannocystis bainbridge TaxID=2995303 RepID=A0ABT5DSF2_9BACT|nr:hypothetical protein [Nannocystis bainbridge]MDC0716575.1 hypothetical protein [Nannocystis bainbridge]